MREQKSITEKRINDLIIGKSLYLREPEFSDFDKIKMIWEDQDTMKDVGGVILLSNHQYITWYERMIVKGKNRNRYFLIFDRISNNCLGEISFHRYNSNNKTADLNIKILKKYRGHGKAKESLDLFLDYYFNKFKGLIMQDKIWINNKSGLNTLINYGFVEKNRNNKEIHIELTRNNFNKIQLTRSGV